jgi:hypothetical protein
VTLTAKGAAHAVLGFYLTLVWLWSHVLEAAELAKPGRLEIRVVTHSRAVGRRSSLAADRASTRSGARIGSAGRLKPAGQRLCVLAVPVRALFLAERCTCVGEEGDGIALRPRVSAAPREATGSLGGVERPLRAISSIPVEDDAPAQHQCVRVVQPHPSRRGDPERLADTPLRLAPVVAAPGEVGLGEQNGRKLGEDAPAPKRDLGRGEVFVGGVERAGERVEAAEQPATAGHVLPPSVLLTNPKGRLGAFPCLRDSAEPKQKVGVPDATPAA